MAKIEMKDLLVQGLDRAMELMALAAHNSFRFGDKNTLKMMSVGREEMEEIAEFCFSLGDMSPLAARDGRFVMELIKEPCGLLIIGDKRKSVFNYNCGACGYRSCAEMNAAEEVESLTANGPSCQFRNLNLNIAANAAASMAWRLGLHCRVFSTLAFAAMAMEVIDRRGPVCVSVSVSAAKVKIPTSTATSSGPRIIGTKSSHKEFPTYNRGFIGAVED